MRTHIVTLLLLAATLFSACKKTPTHADHIPATATAVLGINTAALGKKVAWNALWGSKLLKNMQQKMNDSSMIKELENSGIKTMTTYYAYVQADSRYMGGNKVTAVIPLDDAGKWEAFVKKQFPGVTIKEQKDRKEALLGSDVYAGWTNNLLIVMNTVYQQQENNMNMSAEDMEALDSMGIDTPPAPRKPDEATMAMEIEKALGTTKENAITGNKNFVKLQEEGHDISLWVNYEALMAHNMQQAGSMAGGLAAAGSLWKDAAMAMGIDFETGKIAGKMRYYTSEELRSVYKEMGKGNTDKETIDRLPGDNLNMLAAAHISTKGIRQMLDKLGLIGFVNIPLAQKGLTIEDVADAISGDMAVSVTNFKNMRQTIPADSLYPGQQPITTGTSDADYVFALKIGKQEKFDKLLKVAQNDSMLAPVGNGCYAVPMLMGTKLAIIIDKGYVVLSNKDELAAGYLAGSYKAQKKSGNAGKVYDHASGLYFDVKSMMAGVDTAGAKPADAAMMHNARTLVSDVLFTGGDFKNDAFEYDLDINFINKEENSLLLLLDFANKMNESETANAPVALK